MPHSQPPVCFRPFVRGVHDAVETAFPPSQRKGVPWILRVVEKQVLEHHSIVMRLVVRGEDQRDPTLLRKRA